MEKYVNFIHPRDSDNWYEKHPIINGFHYLSIFLCNGAKKTESPWKKGVVSELLLRFFLDNVIYQLL